MLTRKSATFALILGTAAAILSVSTAPRPAFAAAQPGKLQAALGQMDAGSAKFQSAQADLRQELYTKVVEDTETQYGSIYFIRAANSTQMGMKMAAPGSPAGASPAQVVEFKGSKLRVYNTGTNHLDEFSSAGKNQSLAETFMTLGFGGSGKDLAKAWNITDQGSEQIDGVSVEKLDLVSRDESVKKNFTHIIIWIDPLRDITLKQQFFATSGDTRTGYYTNIRLNQKVDTASFVIKCKGKCG